MNRRPGSQRGSVMVIVALWLPLMALFTSFAIDAAHWWDYSRNLQNRADAAALAAGDAYGGACFGNYTATETDAIGRAAQQYSGPPNGTPNANLPFTFISAAPYQNQPNLTRGAAQNYHVLLNSTQYWNGTNTNWNMGSDVGHQGSSLALCSSTDENGNTGAMADVRLTQTSVAPFIPLLGFSPTITAHARVSLNGVGGETNIIPLAVRDPASERCVEAKFYNDSTGNQIGSSVPLNKIGTDPTTGAVQWDNSAAPASLAIPSAANVYVQIVTGYCDANASTYDSTSGLLYVNSWSTTAPSLGQAPAITQGGVFLTGACSTDNLSNMYFTDQTCSTGVTAHVTFAPLDASGHRIPYGAETVTAKDTNGGATRVLSKVNTQVNGGGNNQVIAAGGTFKVTSTANFPASGSLDDNGPANGSGTVTSLGPYTITDSTHFRLTNGGTVSNNDVITVTGDTTWTSSSPFTINAASGRHPIAISETQTRGTVNGSNCNTGNGCSTPFTVQAQTFGACDDGNPNLTCNNPPDDSGPIVLGQLRLASDPGQKWGSDPLQSFGENAFAGASTQQMIVTVQIAGLSNAKPGDPPTVLRFTENNPNANHATGLIDCGEGQSKTASLASLIDGCPTVGSPNCKEFSACAPLAINKRPLSDPAPCDPEGNDLTGTVVARTAGDPMEPVDCTGTVAGNMPPVVNGLACRIITAGCDKNGKANGTECYSNNWSNTVGSSSVPADDPRAVTVIITAPSDLAKNNSGQIIPIENFAVFYITGWTAQGNNPSCNSYTAPPPGAAMDAENKNNCPDGSVPNNGNCNPNPGKGMIWGFWIKYTDPGAIPLPTLCNVQAFGDCTPALTR